MLHVNNQTFLKNIFKNLDIDTTFLSEYKCKNKKKSFENNKLELEIEGKYKYLRHMFFKFENKEYPVLWKPIKKIKSEKLLMEFGKFRNSFVMNTLNKLKEEFKCDKCIIISTGSKNLDSDLDISIYGLTAVPLAKAFNKIFKKLWNDTSENVFDCNIYADSFYEPATIYNFKLITLNDKNERKHDKIYRLIETYGKDVRDQHQWGIMKV